MWPDVSRREIKDYFDLYDIKPKHFEIDCLLEMVKAANSVE